MSVQSFGLPGQREMLRSFNAESETPCQGRDALNLPWLVVNHITFSSRCPDQIGAPLKRHVHAALHSSLPRWRTLVIRTRRRSVVATVAIVLFSACSSESPSPSLAPTAASSEFDLSVTSGSIQASNQWTTIAPMPVARSYTVTASANGRLYVIGGSDATSIYNLVTEWTPSTNSWATKAPLPTKLNSQLGATTLGSLVYVPGGWNGTAYQSVLNVYDPVANVWTTRTAMPIPGACGGSTALGNIMYVGIGCDFSGETGKLLRYDPVTNGWAQLPNAPGTHSGGTVYAVNGKVYWDNGTVGSGVDVYDPATNAWTPGPGHLTQRVSHVTGVINNVAVSAAGYTTAGALNTSEYLDAKGGTWVARANMPIAVGSASGNVLNGELYVVGGNTANAIEASVQKYTPGDWWVTQTAMPTARAYLSSASVNGDVYVMGGRANAGITPLNSVERYNSVTDSWSTVAPLPAGRWAAAGAAVNGKVYLIGGFAGDTASSATNTVFEYDPATNIWTSRATAPTPIGFASAGVVAGKIYVAVGADGSTFDGKKVYVYTPATNSWTTIANATNSHSEGMAVGVANYFVVVGGRGSGGLNNSIDGFNTTTQGWVSGPSSPATVVGSSGGAVGTAVYQFFGVNNAGVNQNTVSRFDGGTKTWSSRSIAPEALGFTTSAVVSGQIYTFGGFRQNGTTTTATRKYTP